MSLIWYNAALPTQSIPKFSSNGYEDAIRAKKLDRASEYLSVMTNYIDYACNEIDGVSLYCFEKDYYKEEDYARFSRQIAPLFSLNNFTQITDEPIRIISGEAGIGKTLFFREGIFEIKKENGEVISPNTHRDRLLYVDMRHRDEGEGVEYYENIIWTELLSIIYDRMESAQSDVEKALSLPAIRTLSVKVAISYIDKINESEQSPLIMCVDNVDLFGRKTQETILSAIINFRARLNEHIKHKNLKTKYRVLLAKRPDTKFMNEFGHLDTAIDFPHPLVGRIYGAVIKKGLNDALTHYGNTYLDLTLEDGTYLADMEAFTRHFEKIFVDDYLAAWNDGKSLWRKKFGDVDVFHNHLVNFNLRRMLNFFAKSLKCGGFRPLQPCIKDVSPYTMYDHLNFLISGSHYFHPGNGKMDGEGFYHRSPLVMNLFDMDDWSEHCQIRDNYFIYIRIIQFIEIKGGFGEHLVSYRTLEDALSKYFQEEDICTATQRLLFADVIKETALGVRNIGLNEHPSSINLSEKKDEILFSSALPNTASIYFHSLITEFEYLSNMAVSAPLYLDPDDEIVKEHIAEYEASWNKVDYCIKNRERLTYLFLVSMFNVLQENVRKYKQNNLLDEFNQVFTEPNAQTQNTDGASVFYMPWRRMISFYIKTLVRKIHNGKSSEQKKKQMQELVLCSRFLLQKARDIYPCLENDISEEAGDIE